MPKSFERCIDRGGTVKARSLPGNRYQRLCILNGKVYPDYARKRKGSSRSGSRKGRRSSRRR